MHSFRKEWLSGTSGDHAGDVAPARLAEADRAIERIEVAGTRATGRMRFTDPFA